MSNSDYNTTKVPNVTTIVREEYSSISRSPWLVRLIDSSGVIFVVAGEDELRIQNLFGTRNLLGCSIISCSEDDEDGSRSILIDSDWGDDGHAAWLAILTPNEIARVGRFRAMSIVP